MRIRMTGIAAGLVVSVGVAAALAGCGARSGEDVRDEREPDAVGTATAVEAADDGVAVTFAPDPGYEYFEGTTFVFAAGDLEASGGEALGPGDVAEGDRLEVWVDACAESFPVQCADPVGTVLP